MSSGYSQFSNPPDLECGPMGSGAYDAQNPSVNQTKENPPSYPTQQPYITQLQPGPYVYGQAPVQQTITHVATGPVVNDHFCFALFVTLCCCLPFGIVALVKSSDVKNRIAVGDHNGALVSSAEAKRWSWIGCITGGVLWGLTTIGMAVYIGLVVAACNDGYC